MTQNHLQIPINPKYYLILLFLMIGLNIIVNEAFTLKVIMVCILHFRPFLFLLSQAL